MLAMTSIAVTASICASAPEAAPLVASFMPFLPRLGRDSSLRALRTRRPIVFTRNTPLRVSAAMCPHAANIDCAKLDQQCGGILTRCCCSCVAARIEFLGTCPDNNNRKSNSAISNSITYFFFKDGHVRRISRSQDLGFAFKRGIFPVLPWQRNIT